MLLYLCNFFTFLFNFIIFYIFLFYFFRTTGFYLQDVKETFEKVKIENVLLVEDYSNKNSRKVTQDLSVFAKNIIEVFFK